MARLYAPNVHSFFDDLATMIITLSSYMFTMHVSIASNKPVPFQNRPLEEWISYIAPIKAIGFPFALPRQFDGMDLVVFPADLVSICSLRGWPQYIEYYLVPHGSEEVKPNTIRLTGQYSRRILSSIVGASYINYYESTIKGKFGTDISKWPEIIRFAWVIRNGFAHGGLLAISDPDFPPVTWRGVTLDSTNNLQEFLFVEGVLSVGDIIALMEDLDGLIRPS